MLVGMKPLRFVFHSYVGGPQNVVTAPVYRLTVENEIYYALDEYNDLVFSAPVKIVKHVDRQDETVS